LNLKESELRLGDEHPPGYIDHLCSESYSLTRVDIRILHHFGYEKCVIHVPDQGIRLARKDGHCIFAKIVDGMPVCELKEHGDNREPSGCLTADPDDDYLTKYAAVLRDVQLESENLWYKKPD